MSSRLAEILKVASQFGRIPTRKIARYEQLDPESGVSRATGTQADKNIRDYAITCMDELGLEIFIDKVGNIFGRKKGSRASSGTIMCGSHLDSVLCGGQFDGALGVFGAIEAMRKISEEGFTNQRPIEVVAFTGEEGSAFGLPLLGSSVFTGKINVEEALTMKNDDGRTLGEVLASIGYQGTSQRNADDIDYMLELHIEQGPTLYREKIPIGIVENITGISWVVATIWGEGNHAGTTPMKIRKDALVAAAEVISLVKQLAAESSENLGPSVVATVGKLEVFPNGINSIPAKVIMGIDIRDINEENMVSLRNAVVTALKDLEHRHEVRIDVETLPVHQPSPLSREVIDVIDKSTIELGIPAKYMNSGAVHDSQNMAKITKTGMIFVPSVNGISHSPLEWTDWKDVESGVKVLTGVLRQLSA